MGSPVSVEITVRSSVDSVWKAIQDPSNRQLWDLWLSRVERLPESRSQETHEAREAAGTHQRFHVIRAIVPGIQIRGEGIRVAVHGPQSERTSSVHFWSDDWKSPMKSGTGYLRVVQDRDAVRVQARFDYQTRMGFFGRVLDSILLRRLMKWSAAWSLDRMRLWIEKGISPSLSMANSVVYAAARITLASLWLYLGIVPTLVYPDGAIAWAAAFGGQNVNGQTAVTWLAFTQSFLGVLLLLFFRARWLYLLSIFLAFNVLTIGSTTDLLGLYLGQSRIVILTLLTIGFSILGYIVGPHLPSAASCHKTVTVRFTHSPTLARRTHITR